MLTATTDYSVRDLYMSLTDTQGTSWSILFDSAEVMHTCLRTIVAVIVHQATHAETPIAWETLQRALPANAENASSDDQQQLAVGMAAGIYLSVWEIGEVSDYPGDIVAGRALRQVVAPEEVIKIKLAAGVEEVVAGLTTALVGLRKGDRFMLGVSPKVAYKITEGGFINVASRAHPGSWLLVEAEVVKIKSGEGKEKKKEKAAAQAAAAVATPVKAAEVPNDIDYSDNSGGGGNSDLKDRMKRLSHGAGGMNLMAAAASERVNNNSNNNNQNNYNQSPAQNSRKHNDDSGRDNGRDNGRDGGRDSDSRGGNNNNNNGNNRDGDYRDNSNYGRNNNSGSNNNNYNDNYGRVGRDNYNDNNGRSGGGNYNNNNNNYRDNRDNRDSRDNRDNRDHRDNRYNDRNDNRGGYNDYALTVVDGQEARSYYMDDDANSNGLHNRGASERNARPAAASAGLSAGDSSSLQSSMMVIQQSIMQLHTKLDSVGTQVTTSLTLQQQQHAGHAAALVGPYGAAPAGGVNPYGLPPAAPQMGYMGMPGAAPYQQMQMYQQQHHQLHAASPVKLRGEELISSLQFLISEYENSSKNAANSSKNNEHLETINNLKATIAKLEEKNETLQVGR